MSTQQSSLIDVIDRMMIEAHSSRLDVARSSPSFSGATYDPKYDEKRLTGQILRIYDLIRDGRWRTLQEIADSTGDPSSSVSAQLRNLRKLQFGSHTIEKRARGDRSRGLFEYRMVS